MEAENRTTPAISSSELITTPSTGPQGPVPAPCPQGGIHRPAPQPPQLGGESPTTGGGHTLFATYDPGDNKLRLRSLPARP
jgi:hypothetical protein